MSILNEPKFDEFSSIYEQREGLPKGVLRALIQQESGGRTVFGPVIKEGTYKGQRAGGVAQFMPDVAAKYKVDVNDPWDGLRGAAEYLGDLNRKYKGDINAALSFYNGGHWNAQATQQGQGYGAIPGKVSEANRKQNVEYVQKITAKLPTEETQAAVAKGVARNDGDYAVLQELNKAGYDDIISDALSKGYKPSEIVAYLAPEAAKRGADARAQSEAKGAVGRGVDQFTTGLGNIGRSVSRTGSMIAGNDAEVKRKLAEQAAIDNDLVNVADRSTVAGGVGGFVGDNAAAFIPVPGAAGLGFVGRLAAQGLVSGAAQGATTSRAENLSGVLGDAASGAALGAVGGAGIGAGAKALGAAGRFAGKIKNQGAAIAGKELDELGIVSKEAGRSVGIDDLDLRQGAATAEKIKSTIGKRLDDSIEGVNVDPAKLGVSDLLEVANNPHLPRAYRTEARKLVTSGRGEDGSWIVRQQPVAVRELDELRRTIGKDLASPNLNAFQRNALSKLEEKLGDGMEQAFASAPEKLAQFKQAKQQWANGRVIRDLIANTNDNEFNPTALLDPNKWAAAMKRGSGNRSRFLNENAPMKDILKVLQEAKTQSRMKQGVVGNAVNGALDVVDLFPVTGPLARALGFRDLVSKLGDPQVRAAFEKLNPVEQAAVMAKGR